METTLFALMKGSASAFVKKNSTSGSEPVSKSVRTFAFHSSLDVAEPSLMVFPVSASYPATAFSKLARLPSSPP